MVIAAQQKSYVSLNFEGHQEALKLIISYLCFFPTCKIQPMFEFDFCGVHNFETSACVEWEV